MSSQYRTSPLSRVVGLFITPILVVTMGSYGVLAPTPTPSPTPTSTRTSRPPDWMDVYLPIVYKRYVSPITDTPTPTIGPRPATPTKTPTPTIGPRPATPTKTPTH